MVIPTDHFNNTVMKVALKQPDKILRMLLKVEALVVPRWVYAPGRGQLGDGLSRNPEDQVNLRTNIIYPKLSPRLSNLSRNADSAEE